MFFLQAGVGGMAAAMIAGIARYLENIPEIILLNQTVLHV
jgi:threonine dehydratase